MLNFLSLDIFGSPFLYFLLAALAVCAAAFKYTIRDGSKPYLESEFETNLAIAHDRGIDAELVIGSLIYGLGWGLTGITPATGIALFATAIPQIVFVFFPMLVLGASLVSMYEYMNMNSHHALKAHVAQGTVVEQ